MFSRYVIPWLDGTCINGIFEGGLGGNGKRVGENDEVEEVTVCGSIPQSISLSTQVDPTEATKHWLPLSSVGFLSTRPPPTSAVFKNLPSF